jgi:hypothetical protein
MKPAQKTDLAILLPMPTEHITIVLDRSFSKDETDLLKLGFIPRETDDRWFIYFEDNQLYFHRSWTGVCIYQVFLIEAGDTLRMIRANVNRDPEQYKEISVDRDIEAISRVIDTFLLNR